MEKQTLFRRRHRILALLFLISSLLPCGLTWWLHTPSGHTAGFDLEKTRFRLFSPYYVPDPSPSYDADQRSSVTTNFPALFSGGYVKFEQLLQ